MKKKSAITAFSKNPEQELKKRMKHARHITREEFTKHGGARKGSGRKPGITFKEPTVVVRIPKSKVEAVKKLIRA